MKLSQIECFIAVAKAGHFGRGAETIHRSQPPVSRQIRLLEEELGVELLARKPACVELTAAGRAFLLEVEQGMRHLRNGVRAAQNAVRPQTAKLRIATTPSVMLGIFSAVLAKFQRRFPEYGFDLISADKSSQVSMLLEGKIDVAVVRSLTHAQGISAIRLINEPIAAALNSDHPLATRSQLEVKDLSPFPFIIYTGRFSPSVADQLIELCKKAGFVPEVQAEAADMQSAAFMASLSSGIALVAASLQNMVTPNLVYRPVLLEAEPVTMPLYLLHRDGDKARSLHDLIACATRDD